MSTEQWHYNDPPKSGYYLASWIHKYGEFTNAITSELLFIAEAEKGFRWHIGRLYLPLLVLDNEEDSGYITTVYAWQPMPNPAPKEAWDSIQEAKHAIQEAIAKQMTRARRKIEFLEII